MLLTVADFFDKYRRGSGRSLSSSSCSAHLAAKGRFSLLLAATSAPAVPLHLPFLLKLGILDTVLVHDSLEKRERRERRFPVFLLVAEPIVSELCRFDWEVCFESRFEEDLRGTMLSRCPRMRGCSMVVWTNFIHKLGRCDDRNPTSESVSDPCC